MNADVCQSFKTPNSREIGKLSRAPYASRRNSLYRIELPNWKDDPNPKHLHDSRFTGGVECTILVKTAWSMKGEAGRRDPGRGVKGPTPSEQLVQLLAIEPQNNPLADDQSRRHAAAVDLDQLLERGGITRHVQLFKFDAAGREILTQCVAWWSGGLRVKANRGPVHS